MFSYSPRRTYSESAAPPSPGAPATVAAPPLPPPPPADIPAVPAETESSSLPQAAAKQPKPAKTTNEPKDNLDNVHLRLKTIPQPTSRKDAEPHSGYAPCPPAD